MLRPEHAADAGADVDRDLDLLRVLLRPHELNRVGDDLRQVRAGRRDLVLRIAAREVEQVADDAVDALGLALNRARNSSACVGVSSPARSSSTSPRIAASGLPISCATPAARRPTEASFSPWISCCCVVLSSLVVRSSSRRRCSSASRSARSWLGHALNAAARRATSAAPRSGTCTRRAGREQLAAARQAVERAHDQVRERDVREHQHGEPGDRHVEEQQVAERQARARRPSVEPEREPCAPLASTTVTRRHVPAPSPPRD